MKIFIKYLFITMAVLVSMLAHAAGTTYTVDFGDKSPIKNFSLKNVNMKLKIYVFEQPAGFIDVTTNGNQAFTLDESYGSTAAIQILSIDQALKQHIHCDGNAVPGQTKIEILCDKDK